MGLIITKDIGDTFNGALADVKRHAAAFYDMNHDERLSFAASLSQYIYLLRMLRN